MQLAKRDASWGEQDVSFHVTFPMEIRYTRYNKLVSIHVMKTKIPILSAFWLLLPALSLRAQEDSLNRISIMVAGGYSLFTENNKAEKDNFVMAGFDRKDLSTYYRQLATGYNLHAHVRYHLNGTVAVGASYRFLTTSAQTGMTVDAGDGIHFYYGRLEEEIYVNYGGAGLYLTDLPVSARFRLQLGVEAGLAFYRNEMHQMWEPVLLKRKAFAFGPSAVLNYTLSRRISLVWEISWTRSVMKKVTMITADSEETLELSKDQYEDISNVSISTGVSLTL